MRTLDEPAVALGEAIVQRHLLEAVGDAPRVEPVLQLAVALVVERRVHGVLPIDCDRSPSGAAYVSDALRALRQSVEALGRPAEQVGFLVALAPRARILQAFQ